jgi:drug/metabolite transporter (DMT)-like permease
VAESASNPVSAQRGSKIYLLGLLGVIIIWGSSFVVVDVAVRIAPPMALATWRLIFATVLFLIFTPIAKKRGLWKQERINNEPRMPSKRYFLFILVASLAGITFLFPAQYTAISLIGASVPALMVCLASPVIMTVLAIVFFKERLFPLQVVGFILAIIGAFFIVTGGDISRITPTSADFLGNILAILQPILWSVYNIAVKKAQKGGSSFQITSYTTYLGTLGLFLIMVLSGGFDQWVMAISRVEVVVAVIYLAAGCSLFGYLVWNIALDHLQTANVGAFLYAEPFITVLLAWVITKAEVSPFSLLGGGIVLLALVLITKHKAVNLK